MTAGFENHDHTMKRSKVLRSGEVSDQGTIYVGDGCWGKNAREAKADAWYLDIAKEATHVWYLEADKESVKFEASGIGGKVYDRFSLTNTEDKTTVTPL